MYICKINGEIDKEIATKVVPNPKEQTRLCLMGFIILTK